MRPLRILKQGVWYEIHTRINNREPLFRRHKALAIFARVFYELKKWFAFEIRGLNLEDDWLRFYIKPEDGEELPVIMKWLKQTFAQRYNRKEGRIGHIWGDRYGSRIVEGEAPEDVPRGEAAEGERRAAGNIRVRPHYGKPAAKPVFFLNFPFLPAPAPS
ncbi:MAG: transposase [Treponema sp.]|jgi:REP element-mobilizing transposase RayT|nr:transposase [Treponema sp.]